MHGHALSTFFLNPQNRLKIQEGHEMATELDTLRTHTPASLALLRVQGFQVLPNFCNKKSESIRRKPRGSGPMDGVVGFWGFEPKIF